MFNIADFFIRGGVFMYPILVCSVLSLGFFIYKIRLLTHSRIVPSVLTGTAKKLAAEGKYDEVLSLCGRYPSPIGRIITVAVNNAKKGRERIKEAMESAGKLEVVEMEKFNGAVGTIAGLGTLLGLLGTVAGLIHIFATIGSDPVINPTKLASGISEALNNTAFGLLVAIPSLVFFRILDGKVTLLAAHLEKEAAEFSESFDTDKDAR